MAVAIWLACGIVGFGARWLSYEPEQRNVVLRWRSVKWR